MWRYRGIDVVFEGADVAQLERTKRSMPGVIQELIFHPNAQLAPRGSRGTAYWGHPRTSQPLARLSGLHNVTFCFMKYFRGANCCMLSLIAMACCTLCTQFRERSPAAP